jgi:hypothetical protein
VIAHRLLLFELAESLPLVERRPPTDALTAALRFLLCVLGSGAVEGAGMERLPEVARALMVSFRGRVFATIFFSASVLFAALDLTAALSFSR